MLGFLHRLAFVLGLTLYSRGIGQAPFPQGRSVSHLPVIIAEVTLCEALRNLSSQWALKLLLLIPNIVMLDG